MIDELSIVDRAARYVEKRQLLTSVGLPTEWRKQLSAHDVEHLLVYSESLHDIANWTFSDLLVWTEERTAEKLGVRSGKQFWQMRDERWRELNRLSKRGHSQATLYNMRSCASAWPWERRRHTDRIGYEHHRLLSHLSVDEQEYWMDLAMHEDLTSHQLRLALYHGPGALLNGGNSSPVDEVEDPDDYIASCWAEHGLEYRRPSKQTLVLSATSGTMFVHADKIAGKPILRIQMET